MTPPTLAPPASVVRSRMQAQRRKDTQPELAVRRLLHAAGARYRLNVPMPGRPGRTIDIAFPRQRLAVFIDGCFWHRCPEHATRPRNNSEWWDAKLAANYARDQDTIGCLMDAGWTVARFWTHQNPETVAREILSILDGLRSAMA